MGDSWGNWYLSPSLTGTLFNTWGCCTISPGFSRDSWRILVGTGVWITGSIIHCEWDSKGILTDHINLSDWKYLRNETTAGFLKEFRKGSVPLPCWLRQIIRLWRKELRVGVWCPRTGRLTSRCGTVVFTRPAMDGAFSSALSVDVGYFVAPFCCWNCWNCWNCCCCCCCWLLFHDVCNSRYFNSSTCQLSNNLLLSQAH